MTPDRQQLVRAAALTAAVCAAAIAGRPAAQGQTAARPLSLDAAFAAGQFLHDRNGDGIADDFDGGFALGPSASLDEIAVAGDLAARFGFETMALDLPLAASPGSGRVIAVGDAGLTAAGLPVPRVQPALQAGEGLVTTVAAGDRQALFVTGADAAGLRAAGLVAAGRLPHVWTADDPTLRQVTEEIVAVLERGGVGGASAAVSAVRVHAGRDELDRLMVDVLVKNPVDAGRARTLLRTARSTTGAAAPPAEGTPRTPLSYAGARALEIRLSAGSGAALPLTVLRAASPVPPDQPPARRPGSAAKEQLDLSTLFSIDGLLGDSDSNLIPDRLDTVISPSDPAAVRTVDLAARLGLESTGVSVPLVVPADRLGRPEQQPPLVLIGKDHPITIKLAAGGKLVPLTLTPGQGALQIVRKAFGEKHAVVVTGADAAGLDRALRHASERLPHIWERGLDRPTLDDVENDVRRFIGARTPAGQAATAIYKLDRLAATIPRDAESAQARVYVEHAEAGFDRLLSARLAKALPGARTGVTVENRDVQRAVPIIDETFPVASEVDEFWTRLRTDVVPRIKRGEPVTVEARLSEPGDVRARLAREAAAELIKAGARADGTSVIVLSAYKQGYSWLYDVVRPALQGLPIGTMTIRFAEAGPPVEWKQQAMFTPTRWLLEIFPIDEVLARELGIDLSRITFEQTPVGSPTYEVIVSAPDGRELLRRTFEPKYVLRPYFDRFPDYERVRVTTGWIHAATPDRVLLDRRIVTDLERFWDHFQSSTLNRLYDYVMDREKGKPDPAHAPFFGELTVDVSLSEPNEPIGVDKEQLASLNSLHEDIYFATLHFFDVLGRYTRGTPLAYPGRVLPVMRPKGDGRPGTATIRLTGFGASRPMVAVDYVTRGGARKTVDLDIPRVAVERPSAVSAIVRDGREGVERLGLRLKVDTQQDERDALVLRTREERVDEQIMSAEQAAALLTNLAELRAAGLYQSALAYPHLGALDVTMHWFYDDVRGSEAVASLEPGGSPPPLPDIRTLLPAGYRHRGEPIVQWDTPIPPGEANEVMARMAASFPEARAFKVGRSYLGKDIWAMALMSPLEASHWSLAKATALKPTIVYSARQHANEVSSTSHTLRLAELLLTDPSFKPKLARLNVVFHPITNPDGAQVAYDLYRITPDYMLHAGYLGSLGVDVTSQQWDADPVQPESSIRADLWRRWLPDIFLNPHGYPSHEWVMLFSEYAGWVRNRVTESRDWWAMRGWFTPGFGYLDDPKYPRHKEAAFRIRDAFSSRVNAAPEVRALNQRAYARYRRYGAAFDSENFKLDFTNDVLIYTAVKGAKASPTATDFMARNPNVTIWTGGTEAPDETAHGDWMKLVATAGLQWDTAILDYLADGDHQVERKSEPFWGGVSLSVTRPRPPKPRAPEAVTTSPANAVSRKD